MFRAAARQLRPVLSSAALVSLLSFFPFSASPLPQPPVAIAPLPPPPPLPPLAPAAPAAPAYRDGREAVTHISRVFQQALAAQRAGVQLDTEAVLSAGQATAFLYPVIFGHGSLVASILTRITSRHCGILRRVLHEPGTPPEARGSLRALLAWEARMRAERKAAVDRHSATHAALWIMRVLDFIQCYLSIMCRPDNLPPSACARLAYDEKLAPYHGALALAPEGRGALPHTPRPLTAPPRYYHHHHHHHCCCCAPCRLYDIKPIPHCPVVRAQ